MQSHSIHEPYDNIHIKITIQKNFSVFIRALFIFVNFYKNKFLCILFRFILITSFV